MSKPIVIALGEILWDMLPTGKRAGGAPVNFAYHASQNGAESYAISAVGNDELGAELLNDAHKAGINTLVQTNEYPTGTVAVALTNGIPEYTIVQNVAWDHIGYTDELAEAVSKADAICFGTLGLRSQESHDTIIKLLQHAKEGALKFFDINLRANFYSKELIEELLARTGYLAAVGALPDGPRCREDLLSFTAWAAGAGRAGLPSLIRAMDAAAANGGLSQSAGGQTRPGCVSIMTVHRSKGLEFPVVFVADTDHKFNQSDAIRPVLTHSRLGVGVMLRAPRAAKRFKTLPYAALAQAIRTETLSEEMRVLYVALTRAQDALIITVPLKKTASSLKLPALCAAAEATGPEAMRSMTSWAGWILTAALLHPDSSALWEYTSFLPHYGLHRAPLAIRVLPLPEETEQPPAPPAPAADPAVVETLKASFAWRSPREALEKVPAKVSVSAVAHAARPVALERPAFLQKTGMTGAERGTAIHAFMQSVPFDGPAPDLDAEVRRQTDLQLLDPALADKLDLDAVRPFFASAVWRRIRLAKQILREEPFITALPAAEVTPAAGQGSAAAAEVLVQGIADLVLVFDEHAEILDYKTDRSRDAQYYIDEYAAQLRLYRRAFAQRLAVPVTKLTIYSFAIEDEIDVPLA